MKNNPTGLVPVDQGLCTSHYRSAIRLIRIEPGIAEPSDVVVQFLETGSL